MTTQKLGYAYSNDDRDDDGLPNGFEQVAGTSPDHADSDGDDSDGNHDGRDDAFEYPMVGIPQSDPCADGPYAAARCGADVIFRHGFER